MKGPLLLGVDGGGTSTTAWLADGEGTVLGRGTAGPSNAKAVGVAAALASLGKAVDGAFDAAGIAPCPVDVACLGVAGFGRADDWQVLHEWADRRQLSRRLLPVTDGDLVVAAGTPNGWGVGVIAGTGSIAVGRDPQGRVARAGGWGYLLDDEGSAYAVVLAALRRVARRADGREAPAIVPDPLTVRILRAFGIDEPQQLIAAVYAPECDRARLAGLAPVVVEAAEADPGIIPDLLEPAGAALAEMVTAVARALGWQDGPLPLACGGSFLLASGAVFESLLAHLRRSGYEPLTVRVPEPVRGALVLAGRALQAVDARAVV